MTSISGRTQVVGIVGHPVSHSKSPFIHNYWCQQFSVDGVYIPVPIAPEHAKENIASLGQLGFRGVNITIPYKEVAYQICHTHDKLASLCHAVNTICYVGEKICGYNTDVVGFVQNIKHHSHEEIFQHKSVYILGAGGAARAAIVGAISEGAKKVFISNRTGDKAEQLVAQFHHHIEMELVPWQQRSDIMPEVDILVNSTSLGMDGSPPLEMDLSRSKASLIVNDMVYAPLKTPLLKQAHALDRTAVTGIGMLLHQAAPAFHLWFGVMPLVDTHLTEKVLSL